METARQMFRLVTNMIVNDLQEEEEEEQEQEQEQEQEEQEQEETKKSEALTAAQLLIQ